MNPLNLTRTSLPVLLTLSSLVLACVSDELPQHSDSTFGPAESESGDGDGDGDLHGDGDGDGDGDLPGDGDGDLPGDGDGDLPGDGDGDPQPLEPLSDFSIGPYPSALTMLLDSLASNAASYDTATTYTHSAAQGYTLQAIAATLRAAEGHELPGGEDQGRALLDLGLGEVAELESAAGLVAGGGPAFGLEDAWDAFGDGSVNPAMTAYTWQSGMVALGIAELLRASETLDGLSVDQLDALADAEIFLTALVDYWWPYYTAVDLGGGIEGGYFWYSDRPSDAKAVHNTSALIAMAAALLGDRLGDPGYAARAQTHANLLWARVSVTNEGGYSWNYVDDGWPVEQRRAEDVSHALVTTQFIRACNDRGWWSDAALGRTATTLLAQMWSGHPGRLHGRVDGSSGGESEWTWSRAAVIAYAVHGDAPGGRPEVFDYARSLLLSSYLTPTSRPLEGGTTSSAQTLALARMFERRPADFEADSDYVTVAGDPDDDAIPVEPGGVRFYTVDWAPAAAATVGGLELPARQGTAANANFLVDLDDAEAAPVVVSLTYAADTDGTIGQYDGQQYVPLTSLPASRDKDGVTRWMRTSFVLDGQRFDYQAGVAGLNVLLQTTAIIRVHQVEATVLDY